MGMETKKLERSFELAVDFGLHSQFAVIARDALDLIEQDIIHVFRPDDPDCLRTIVSDGEEVVAANASEPISVKEWLPLACQMISFDPRSNDAALACYAHNLHGALLPTEEVHRPPGPAGFSGEIRFTQSGIDLIFALAKKNGEQAADAFRFIIAHELVHSIHLLKILVPAYRDWAAFWSGPLEEGRAGDDAAWVYQAHANVLDQYATDAERDCVAEFWPSHADRWFQALRHNTV